MNAWDESRRLLNIVNHGTDFAELKTIFDFPMATVEDDRLAYGEMRLRSYGWHNGRVVLLIWTERGDDGAHLISCRYGDKYETKHYFKNANI